MTAHTLSIAFIYLCTCAAWWILGTTIYMRTQEAPSQQRQGVESAWGKPQQQQSPRVWFCGGPPAEALASNGRDGQTTDAPSATEGCTVPVDLTQSRLRAALDLEHRRKGLAWFSSYGVDFRATYRAANTSTEQRRVYVEFSLPNGQSVFDGFKATLNGKDISHSIRNSKLSAYRDLAPGEELALQVAYRSQGLDQWTYALPKGVSRVNDFQLLMRTNFPRIDFPAGTLAATSRVQTKTGWDLEWSYESLLTDLGIGMVMPARLQPGELAGRITFFAPVALLFYFFLMLMLTVKRGIALHAMNYFSWQPRSSHSISCWPIR